MCALYAHDRGSGFEWVALRPGNVRVKSLVKTTTSGIHGRGERGNRYEWGAFSTKKLGGKLKDYL